MNSNTKSAKKQEVQFFYELHRTPPAVQAKYPDGTAYRSYLDGRTFWLLNGGYEIPAPGCPFPAQVFTANVFAFLFRNRRALLSTALVVAALVVAQFFLWQLPDAPIDEAKLSFIALVSFAVNGTLLLLPCLTAVWFFVQNLRHSIILQREEKEALQLGAGEISVAPDSIVMSASPDEDPAEYADRIDAAHSSQKFGEWIAVVSFQNKEGSVTFEPVDSDGTFYGVRFTRDAWGMADRAAGSPDYERETWAQYRAYCQQFAIDFKEWAKMEKPNYGITPIGVLTSGLRASAKKAAVCLALILFSAIPSFAQKSAQVVNYLGTYRYQNDKPSGEVKFHFRKAVLPRRGDGTKTYKQLLSSGALYDDSDNAGKLVGITVNGETIQPEKMVTNLATSETRPIPDALSLPDSIAMEQKLGGIKAQVNGWRAKAWQSIKPVWAFVMWFFTSMLAPFLVLLGGWMRYIAKSAAGEGAVNPYGGSVFGPFMVWVHQNFSASLMVIVWTTATVLLFDSFLWLVWWDFSLWSIIPVWLLELWLAQWVTNWIVPNVRVVSGGFNGNQTGNRFPQIGG